MKVVAKQPSAFHPSAVVSSTPLKPNCAQVEVSELSDSDLPIKGHKIRFDTASTCAVPISAVEGASSLMHDSASPLTTNTTMQRTVKSSPLASLGEVMRSTIGNETPRKVANLHHRVIHSPPNASYRLSAGVSQSPNLKEKTPNLTSAMVKLNLSSFVAKSPILREKFLRIQQERDSNTLKEVEGQWVVQSPDKEAGLIDGDKGSSDQKPTPKLEDPESISYRQTSPVRYRNEIETSDFSDGSPIKRRRTESPERPRERTVAKSGKSVPQSRQITPPNQWDKVGFSSPEKQITNPPRRISPVRRPSKTLDDNQTKKTLKTSTEPVKPKLGIVMPRAPIKLTNEMTSSDNVIVKRAEDRRPKLMDKRGALYTMPKSPGDDVHASGTSNSRQKQVPDVMKKATLSPEEFLKSLVRSSRNNGMSYEENLQPSQRGAPANVTVRDKGAVGDCPGVGAKKKASGETKKFAQSLANKIAEQRKTHGRHGRDSNQISNDSSEPRSTVRDHHGGARPKTGPVRQDRTEPLQAASKRQELRQPPNKPKSEGARPKSYGPILAIPPHQKAVPILEKWKRPIHTKPEPITKRNLNRDLANLQPDSRRLYLAEGFHHHLESLSRDRALLQGQRTCLGINSTNDETLDDISSISSLRSVEAEPVHRPAPSLVSIADTSSTAWTKTGPLNDLDLDTSSTRRLVENLQQPKVRKTYRNTSQSKKFTPPFLPIEPAAASKRELDQSVIVPKLITQVVLDERKTRRGKAGKSSTTQPSKTQQKNYPKADENLQKSCGISDLDFSMNSAASSKKSVSKSELSVSRSGAKSGAKMGVGTGLSVGKPGVSDASPVKRSQLSDKEKKRAYDVKLISSLKSSLKSEIEYLVRTRPGVSTDELVRALKLAESLPTGALSTSNRPPDTASSASSFSSARGALGHSVSVDRSVLTNCVSGASGHSESGLIRADTYEILNEAQWGELDTVPTIDTYESTKYSPQKHGKDRSTHSSMSESMMSVRSAMNDSCLAAGTSRSDQRMDERSPRSRVRATDEFTYTQSSGTARSAGDQRSSRSLMSLFDSRIMELLLDSSKAETPRTTRFLSDTAESFDLELLRSARIQAVEKGNKVKYDVRSSASGDVSRDERSNLAPRSSRSVEAARVTHAIGHVRDLTLSSSVAVSPQTNPTSTISKSRTLDRKSRHQIGKQPSPIDELYFEAQRMDLKASLKGVKEKLETLRADLETSPKLEPSGIGSPQGETKGRCETDREQDLSISTPKSGVRASVPGAPGEAISPQVLTPLSASLRLSEIEERMKSQHETKERSLVLTLHENYLRRLATQCQGEINMIRRVKKNEMSYDDYTREMLDILADKLENLHLLKSRILSIPR